MAKGAISAPVLTPVTILNVGRVPMAVHPLMIPAPNAPLSPPPETAKKIGGWNLRRQGARGTQCGGFPRAGLQHPLPPSAWHRIGVEAGVGNAERLRPVRIAPGHRVAAVGNRAARCDEADRGNGQKAAPCPL